MLNKKAQVSEIMSWVIATIIIISILLLFVYASSLLAQKTKIVKVKSLKIDSEQEVDLIATKNLIAYSSASGSEKKIIEEWQEENEDEK